jgi:hypothetical protein
VLTPEWVWLAYGGAAILALVFASLLVILLFGVPWQAYRRGHGFLSWFVLQVITVNPVYPMILVAILPDRAKIRLREQFTQELDDRLGKRGNRPTLPTAPAADPLRSVGDLPTSGKSVGDLPTAAPNQDRSVGDWETRGLDN